MNQPTEQFIEEMGRHFDEVGVPRIAGRLFGALMMHEEPCSLDELAEELQVSKGSVSSNARMLEGWGVIDRVTKPGDRRDYYQIADDVQARMLEREIGRVRRMLDRLREAEAKLPLKKQAVRDRFQNLISFHERALQVLASELDGVRILPRRPDAA